jgi:hypothetical protein
MRLGEKPKKSPKTIFLEALERTFQILGTYESFFPNQIRILSKWKVHFYYFERDILTREVLVNARRKFENFFRMLYR